MNLQQQILDKYALIQEKVAFLEACALNEGFSNCKAWITKRDNTPKDKQERFLKMIELRLVDDEKINQINVQNYKIISDEILVNN